MLRPQSKGARDRLATVSAPRRQRRPDAAAQPDVHSRKNNCRGAGGGGDDVLPYLFDPVTQSRADAVIRKKLLDVRLDGAKFC